MGTIGRSQETTIINESGLYSLIIRIRKPEAKRFKKWVISELLPSINNKTLLGRKDTLDNSILFDFESTSIRVVNREGEAWFVGSDVARALGYSDTDQAIRKHCKASENFKPVDLTGLGIKAHSPRGLTLIPERDVYRLVMRSKGLVPIC